MTQGWRLTENSDELPSEGPAYEPQLPDIQDLYGGPPPPGSGTSAYSLHTEYSEIYFGPLPPPRLLAEFDSIVEGSAEILIKRMEKQSDHRMELEKMVVAGNVQSQRWGLVIGGLLVVFVSMVSVILMLNDATAGGVALIVAELVALAGVFVFGRTRQERERQAVAPPEVGRHTRS